MGRREEEERRRGKNGEERRMKERRRRKERRREKDGEKEEGEEGRGGGRRRKDGRRKRRRKGRRGGGSLHPVNLALPHRTRGGLLGTSRGAPLDPLGLAGVTPTSGKGVGAGAAPPGAPREWILGSRPHPPGAGFSEGARRDGIRLDPHLGEILAAGKGRSRSWSRGLWGTVGRVLDSLDLGIRGLKAAEGAQRGGGVNCGDPGVGI